MALIVTERNLAEQLRVASRRMVTRQLVVVQASDETVALLRTTMENLATAGEPINGRRMAGMQKCATTLATQIGRTVDLAAQLADPAPVSRRVQGLVQQRVVLLDELAKLVARKVLAAGAAAISADQVRVLLRRLQAEIATAAQGKELRKQARMAPRDVVEPTELCDKEKTPELVLHDAVSTGVYLASPRGFEPL